MLTHERPPVSRVREIRMHGLNGGPFPCGSSSKANRYAISIPLLKIGRL